VDDQRHDPAALLPGKTRYPLYRRLDGLQGRSGWVRKNSPPPGFDPRTVQPIVSRYNEWAISAQVFILIKENDLNAINSIPITAESVYNDIGLCDISYITSDIPPRTPQQYNPRLKRHSFKGAQNIPFHDVITEFRYTLNRIKSECSTTGFRFWRWLTMHTATLKMEELTKRHHVLWILTTRQIVVTKLVRFDDSKDRNLKSQAVVRQMFIKLVFRRLSLCSIINSVCIYIISQSNTTFWVITIKRQLNHLYQHVSAPLIKPFSGWALKSVTYNYQCYKEYEISFTCY